MPRPPKTPPPAETSAKAFPSVSIVEKRIASGAPNLRKLASFTLKDQPEPMVIRSFNCGDQGMAGRFHVATEELGWVPVRPEEIAGGLRGEGIRAKDGQVVSGHRGEEVWMKMPKRYHTEIAKAKSDRIERDMRSKSRLVSRTRADMEREAKTADQAGAEQLERSAEALSGLEVETLRVGTEVVELER